MDGLKSRFGQLLLSELGLLAEDKPRGALKWGGRLLYTPNQAEVVSIPNVLQCLLVTALVVSDVIEIAYISFDHKEKPKSIPKGYGGGGALKRSVHSRSTIEEAIEMAGGNLTRAARVLDVGKNRLVADMRSFGIRLPLSAVTVRRLGQSKLVSIRRALCQGVQKKDIQISLGVAFWTIDLALQL